MYSVCVDGSGAPPIIPLWLTPWVAQRTPAQWGQSWLSPQWSSPGLCPWRAMSPALWSNGTLSQALQLLSPRLHSLDQRSHALMITGPDRWCRGRQVRVEDTGGSRHCGRLENRAPTYWERLLRNFSQLLPRRDSRPQSLKTNGKYGIVWNLLIVYVDSKLMF